MCTKIRRKAPGVLGQDLGGVYNECSNVWAKHTLEKTILGQKYS